MGKFLWGTLIGVIFGCGPYFAMRKLYEQSVEQTGASTARYKENAIIEANANSRLYYTDLTNSWEVSFEPISADSIVPSNKVKTAKDNKRWKFTINMSSREIPLTGDASKYTVAEVSNEYHFNPASLTNCAKVLKPKLTLDSIIRR